MNNLRIRNFVLIFVATIASFALLIAAPVFGNGDGTERSQTWPSRTPTSAGPGPTQNPPATAVNPGQTPVATDQPGLTPGAGEATPVNGSSPSAGVAPLPPAGVDPVASPANETILPIQTNTVQLPSAADVGDCGFPPLIVALGTISVRSGPGVEHETVAKLAYQDERPILGRAAAAPWWLIQLTADQQAWVSDLAVSVVGFTGVVPIIANSDIDDGDQPLWQPTPNPQCTPPAQETIAAGTALLVAASAGPNRNSATMSPVEPALVSDAESSAADVKSPGFSLLEPDDAAPGTNLLWLPAVGAFLILAGGIALIVQRRQG